MNETCGCCGETTGEPATVGGRPGLAAIPYRVGVHGSFLAAMIARLSSAEHPDVGPLTTRERSDPAIALLDAWACVADVLSFYQERIANEGFLRTAVERRSVLELARLIGYQPRPGVAASTFLAFTLEPNVNDKVVIPAGTRAQSVPGPERLQPQPFETGEPLEAAAGWSAMRPRQNRGQNLGELVGGGEQPLKLWFKGILADLALGSQIIVKVGESEHIYTLTGSASDKKNDRTCLELNPWAAEGERGNNTNTVFKIDPLIVASLRKITLSRQALSATTSVKPVLANILGRDSTVWLRLLANQNQLRTNELIKPISAPIPRQLGSKDGVFVLRQPAALFGYKLTQRFGVDVNTATVSEVDPFKSLKPTNNADAEANNRLFLNGGYPAILRGQWVAIQKPDDTEPNAFQVDSVTVRSRKAYGLEMPTTVLTLKGNWWENADRHTDNLERNIRGTVVYIQSEQLELALAPDETPLGGDGDESDDTTGSEKNTIELDTVYDFMEVGRRLIVAGERFDLPGVMVSELVVVASEKILYPDEKTRPGEPARTVISLQSDLQHSYRRDTVTIYGNVVPATHGETRRETLGSGDAATPLQQFTLRQAPLTYLAAPTAVGAESTLELRVNDVRWHEAPRLAGLAPTDRSYILRTDDEQKTTVIFGSGEQGARLPSGVENVRAVYRTGIGKLGNVAAERITLLATRPFGVKAVTNPLAATGGADRESRDQARRNAPLAVMALDRIVSVQDYADFARSFAGIGKASATAISDGAQQLVHLTIAGTDDIPIAPTSELYLNLVAALRRQGNPYQPFVVAQRELMALLISARVRIHPDYLWEKVAAQIRARLTDHFSFDRRELAQDVTSGEVLAAIQAVPGVTFVDLDLLEGFDETTVKDSEAFTEILEELIKKTEQSKSRPAPHVQALLARRYKPKQPVKNHKEQPSRQEEDQSDEPKPEFLPARLVYLPPGVPELIILELLP